MRLPGALSALSALRGLLAELREDEGKPLVVGGAHELARVLERELARDGDASAVRVGDPSGAAVYVHICAPRRGSLDDVALKRARKARVPVIAVGDTDDVLATDVVPLPPGRPLPVEEIVACIAAKLGEDGAPLAGRLPVLRDAVCERIVESFARKNGIVAAAVFIPGVDLPVLARNQVRMLLRLDQAFGRELRPLPEGVAVLAAGLGLRTVARELLDLVPVAGWAVKGGVAYAGTRALGHAAVLRLQSAQDTNKGPS